MFNIDQPVIGRIIVQLFKKKKLSYSRLKEYLSKYK